MAVSSEQPVILAQGLTKHYNGLVAVNGISFEVRKGECFGFLGPNGAGKTTTIRVLSCFSPATAGRVWVLGLRVGQEDRAIKAQLGVVPQDDNLDPDLTVQENLLVYGRYFDLPGKVARERGEELLQFLQLTEKRHVKIPALSGGMRRRLIIARALLNAPRVLILDEPTRGLDPQARHLIWEKLRKLKASGTTMVLTTHYMEEAAQLCDRLVIMDSGRILTEGTPRALIAEHVGREVVEARLGQHEISRVLAKLQLEKGYERAGDTVLFFIGPGDGALRAALEKEIEIFAHRPATLEDVFLKLTGRELRE